MSARVWCHLGDRDGCHSSTRSLQTATQVLDWSLNNNSRGLDIITSIIFMVNFPARLSLWQWPDTHYLRWWECIYPKTAITPPLPIFWLKQQIQFSCKNHKYIKGWTKFWFKILSATMSHRHIKQRDRAKLQRWGDIKELERCMVYGRHTPDSICLFCPAELKFRWI